MATRGNKTEAKAPPVSARPTPEQESARTAELLASIQTRQVVLNGDVVGGEPGYIYHAIPLVMTPAGKVPHPQELAVKKEIGWDPVPEDDGAVMVGFTNHYLLRMTHDRMRLRDTAEAIALGREIIFVDSMPKPDRSIRRSLQFPDGNLTDEQQTILDSLVATKQQQQAEKRQRSKVLREKAQELKRA